jgi:transposase-like protein
MAVKKDTTIAGRIGDGSLNAEIAAHSARIRKGNHRCSLSRCPHCDRVPESTLFFRRHALRQREFLVIEGRYVHAVEGLLARWRCPFCHRTFTEYPSFALSHKRYAVQQIAPKALDYVEDDGASYRKAVLDNYLPIFHCLGPADDSGVCIDREPTLAHTTLYRWVSTLGNNTRPVPSNDRPPPRFMPVEWKFLTLSRRNVLLACRHHCRVLATIC